MAREFDGVARRTRALGALRRMHEGDTTIAPDERWTPAVSRGERLGMAALLAGIAWVAALTRPAGVDVLAVVMASSWTALVLGAAVYGIVRDTRDGAQW